MITLQDLSLIGTCIATQELLDAKRLREGFCDYCLLRLPDPSLREELSSIKKELNSFTTRRRFFHGYKVVLLASFDRILSRLVYFVRVDPRLTERVIACARELMERVVKSDSFDEVSELESEFKQKVTLPVFELFKLSTRT
jgi:hypothetical protein